MMKKLDKDWMLGFEIGFWILVVFIYCVELALWPGSTLTVTFGAGLYWLMIKGAGDVDQHKKH